MEMIDFTPLVQAIITLASAAVTIFLIPWLHERFGNERLEKIKTWVQIAVYAAEKAYGAGNGDQKLAFAEQVLAEHKIKLDTKTLKALVDAEIKKMEQSDSFVEIDPLAIDPLAELVNVKPDEGDDV